ncbi:MAG: NAD(P)H-hydrate dehydratase [Thermoanaerobaculia bacterium]
MRVLTAAEARAFDRWAIDELGVPALVLMENAALALAEAVGASFGAARRVAIFCGPGNNGGDGLALARQLKTRGYEVGIFLAAFGRPLSDDCARQLAICRALDLAIFELGNDWPEGAASAATADLVVDALFGTGLERPLRAPYAALVDWLNELPLPRLAVDIPSGLDASRAAPIGPAIRADATVTFGAPKIAHFLLPAAEWVGELSVADLGVPFDASPSAVGDLEVLTAEDLAHALPIRASGAHKGEFGHLLLVAGSRGKAGAAILAARGALLGGAGLVTVATVESAWAAVASAVPEAMSLPLAADATGGLPFVTLARLLQAAEERDVLAVGPGLGKSAGTFRLVRSLVLGATGTPVVLDADGLNAFAGPEAAAGRRGRTSKGGLELLAQRRAPTVLTPHPGELARLLGCPTAEVESDRLASVRRAAELSGAIVVLKGARTLVGLPSGEVSINTTGNPAMASGGSGDVLTGLLAARLAQGDDPLFAAQLAVHLHGLAGDLAVAAGSAPALPAGTLADYLPQAYAALGKA